MASLDGRRILVGITGSVAAYKSCELIRLLVDAGATTQGAMTVSARHFIGATTIQALTGMPPVVDMFAGDGSPDGMDHIAAVRKADLMAIAPASASSIARMACGLADDPVSALVCAATCPVLVAPAMNREMWANPAVRRNIATLKADGRLVVEPESGSLACGEHGEGRLAEPARIVKRIGAALGAGGDGGKGGTGLVGRTVVVSTGATAEPIDKMRVISNRSSGKMGVAVAEAMRDAGANVSLIAAQVQVPLPSGMEMTVRATSVKDMRKAALRLCKGADAFLSVAAVSDFRPKTVHKGKIPRGDGGVSVDLVPCPDIIAEVASQPGAPYCVAFSAEASDGDEALRRARTKMRAKGVQAIIASPIAKNLGSDRCELTFLAGRTKIRIGPASKRVAADKITALLTTRLPR